MRKNNHGFTLIELLATILVLSLIMGLAIPSIMGVISNAKKESYKTTIKNIESIAMVYLKENSDRISFISTSQSEYQCIKVKHLIDSGYFDNDILDSKVNDDDFVDENMYIYVSRNLENKTINESKLILNTNLENYCDSINGTLNKRIDFQYDRGWEKVKDVKITYTLSNVTDIDQINDYVYSHKINSDSKVETTFDKKVITKTITITKPSTITAMIDYTKESDPYFKTINITKVDSDAPYIKNLPGDTRYQKGKNITVTIEDVSGGSGFEPGDSTLSVKYGWSKSSTIEPTTYNNGTLTYSNCNSVDTECQKATFQAIGEGMTGDYYLWVIPNMHDIAGNEVAQAVSTGTYKFDNDKPIVNISAKDYNTFDYSESVDNVSIAGYYVNTTGTNPTISSSWGNGSTYDVDNAQTYYVWAIDEAGNISDKSSITSYSVTVNEGVGTDIKVLYKDASGSEIVSPMYVLNGTNIYITGTALSGYNELLLSFNGETISSGTIKTINANSTITSSATLNTITINYYLGNGSGTAGSTKLATTSTCNINTNCKLETFANLGGTFPGDDNKWTFAGWSASETEPSVTYTDGGVVNRTTTTALNLYAVGSRTFEFYSGIAPTLGVTQVQYWIPYSTSDTYVTSISVPALTSLIDYGWIQLGYRASENLDGSVTISTIGTFKPKPTVLTSMIFRGKYSRNVMLFYNGNGATNGSVASSTKTQYYSSGYAKNGVNTGAKTSTVTYTLASNGFIRTNYTFNKWADGSASGTQYAVGDSYSWNPVVNSSVTGKTMYATWKANTITITDISISGYVNGDAIVGNTLTASVTANPTSTYSYRWYYTTTSGGFNSSKSGVAITGCTTSTCTIPDDARGKYMYVEVTASKDNYMSATATSATTPAVKKTYVYTVTFDSQNIPIVHSGNTSLSTIMLSCTDVTTAATGSCTVSSPEIVKKDSYDIIGWGTSSSATTAAVASGGKITLTADKTYYALVKHLDKMGPTIIFNPDGDLTPAKKHSSVITVTDDSGVDFVKYVWSTSSSASAVSGVDTSSGSTLTKSDVNGIYYLCVYAVDKEGNSNNECSNAFVFDNTAPSISGSTSVCVLKGRTFNVAEYFSISDTNSYSIESSGSVNTGATGTYTATVTATDDSGNSASKVLTVNVYTKISNEGTVSSGAGLYADTIAGGRYYYRGSNPNNYIKFNGQTWRIISVEADGTYKLVYDGGYSKQKYHTSNSTGTFTSTTIYNYLNSTFYGTMNSTAKTQISSHNFSFGTVKLTSSSTITITSTVDLENSTYVSMNVGLPNVTDYLRASGSCTNSTKWSTFNASPYRCKKENWMFTSYEYWFLNPYSSSRARFLRDYGSVGYDQATLSDIYVRPVVYLKNTTTFMGAGTSSNPYTISSSCNVNVGCTLNTTSDYESTKTLTISSTTDDVTYSFDGSNYGSVNTKNVSSAGTYTAYVKSSQTGVVGTCSLKINSRNEYQHSTCTSCKSCYYCSSGGIYCNLGQSNPAHGCHKNELSAGNGEQYYCTDSLDGAWNPCNNKCYYDYLGPATLGKNCSQCGCSTWDTSDSKWYTTSCGTSNKSTCKDRNTRTVYGK